jgi:hypothetical protein
LQDGVVEVLPQDTLVAVAVFLVREAVLVVCEDKTNMNSAIHQTYDEICDDVITHVSLFCKLGLTFAHDLCAERISKDMVSDEELGETVPTHICDCSLFIEHDMDTCPEFQVSCSASNPCNGGVNLTKLLRATDCTQEFRNIGSFSICGSTQSILSQIIRERTTEGCTCHSLLDYTHAPPAHVEQLLASRLHNSWDPGGLTVASLALNSTPFAGHNNVYSRSNLLMNLMGWKDNKAIVLTVEHYFQWDPGIMMTFLIDAMACMDELSDILSLLEGAITANAFESQLQYKQ